MENTKMAKMENTKRANGKWKLKNLDMSPALNGWLATGYCQEKFGFAEKISMTSFSCPPVYVKRAIVDIEEQMKKILAHFLNSLHVGVVQNIKINQEQFYRQHFIFFPSLFKTRHSNVSLLKSIGLFIFLLCVKLSVFCPSVLWKV